MKSNACVALQAVTGDGSTFAPYAFTDPVINIEAYQASRGQSATIDAFIANCRLQDRFEWNPDYVAGAVNAWIKARFDLTSSFAESPGDDPVRYGGSGGCFIFAVGN